MQASSGKERSSPWGASLLTVIAVIVLSVAAIGFVWFNDVPLYAEEAAQAEAAEQAEAVGRKGLEAVLEALGAAKAAEKRAEAALRALKIAARQSNYRIIREAEVSAAVEAERAQDVVSSTVEILQSVVARTPSIGIRLGAMNLGDLPGALVDALADAVKGTRKREEPFSIAMRAGRFRILKHSGGYSYAAGELISAETSNIIGSISAAACATRRPLSSNESRPEVVLGDIMGMIQDEGNKGALFVLPSLFNGMQRGVEEMCDYIGREEVGCRGQMAIHPALCQFVLDNAETARRDGINFIKRVIEKLPRFSVSDGKLSIKACDEKEAPERLEELESRLHLIRQLLARGVPASGLDPKQKRLLSKAKHSVDIIYATPAHGKANDAFGWEAWALLVEAQYRQVLCQRRLGAKIFLLPLGGTVLSQACDADLIARVFGDGAVVLARDERERSAYFQRIDPASAKRGFVLVGKEADYKLRLAKPFREGGAKARKTTVVAGKYKCDAEGVIVSAGSVVGRFRSLPISERPFQTSFFAGAGRGRLTVVDGEIMREIGDPENGDAVFVLPSQLNAAEYSSHRAVVRDISEYLYDNTGGPRGQLAVHPAMGQFILDHAATSERPGGIDGMREVLIGMGRHAFGFEVVNGYLKIPAAGTEAALEALKASLHRMRCHAAFDVPAAGLAPDLSKLSDRTHSVNLVYASAVPVAAYVNKTDVPADKAFQARVARIVRLGQYYGALRAALRAKKKLVYLTPLGGGAFLNDFESIAETMRSAIREVGGNLEVRVLVHGGDEATKMRSGE